MPAEGSSRLRLAARGDTLTIAVHGVLDSAIVGLIAEAAAEAAGDDGRRVQIDLGDLEGHTDDGLAAFAVMRSRFAPGMRSRVSYRASSAAGQEALLAACARAG